MKMDSHLLAKVSFPVRWVMDPKVSPLRHLAAAQRFQIMCLLGTMWTLIFCLSLGLWAHYGFLLASHALMALGALITGLTFYFASNINAGTQPVATQD
jgi:hypothetical protein